MWFRRLSGSMTTSDNRSPVPKRASDVPVWIWGCVGGAVYVALMQVLLIYSGFTTEVMWLWPLGLAEAWEAGRVTGFLGSAEWWLAFMFPVSVAALGFLATYSYLRSRSFLSAAVAAVYIAAFAFTEFALGLEWGILFVLAAPIAAAVALLVHLAGEGWLVSTEDRS